MTDHLPAAEIPPSLFVLIAAIVAIVILEILVVRHFDRLAAADRSDFYKLWNQGKCEIVDLHDRSAALLSSDRDVRLRCNGETWRVISVTHDVADSDVAEFITRHQP